MSNHPTASQRLDRHYRRHYTGEAAQYDRHRFAHQRGQDFNSAEQRTILELVRDAPGPRLLDVAAGTGRIASYLAAAGLDVTALDLTHSMLLQAQRRGSALPEAQLRFVEGNGRAQPFADGQFDAVISIRFLHLFPAALHRPFVCEMWRVLRPGGVLLVQLDSALAGGVVTYGRELYRRLLRGHKPRYYVWPHQVARTFAGIAGARLYGFSPIGARALRGRAPGAAQALERFVATGGRSYLANRVFVRAVKPAAAEAGR